MPTLDDISAFVIGAASGTPVAVPVLSSMMIVAFGATKFFPDSGFNRVTS